MDSEMVWRLFQPYIEVRLEHLDLGLECRTIVVSQDNDLLVRFARAMILMATGVKTRIKSEEDIGFFRRQLEHAIDQGWLHGPADLRLDKVHNLNDLVGQLPEEYRVELFDSPVGKRARVEPCPQVMVLSTPVGDLYQVVKSGRVILRVLFFVEEIEELAPVAARISRETQLGEAELVFLLGSGQVVAPVDAKAVVLQQWIDGFVVLGLYTQLKDVHDEVLNALAQRVLSGKLIRIRPLTQGEKSGRIPLELPNNQVALAVSDVVDLGPNSVAQELFGFDKTPLVYGATDIGGNWVELLQLWVACARTGLPGIFHVESRAHALGDYYDRILGPSIALLGNGTYLPVEMRDVRLDQINASDLFHALGLELPDYLKRLSYQGVASFYRSVHERLIVRFNELIGADVEIALVDAEKLFSVTAEELTMAQAVERLRTLFPTANRVLLNRYQSFGVEHVRISDVSTSDMHRLVNDLLAGPGVWPGGVLTYLMMSSIGHHGPVWFNLKDSRLGQVARAATVDLPVGTRRNQVHFANSGVTRCYPVTSAGVGGDNIDPVVVMLLLEKYPEMSKMVRAMADSWVFPVTLEQVGLIRVYRVAYCGQWSMTRYLESNQGWRP